jgi:hypothetical protein
MKLREVGGSTAIQSVGHDAATKTLHVRFHSGEKTYRYENVTAEEHSRLMSAESLGKHFAKHIRAKGGAPVEDAPA